MLSSIWIGCPKEDLKGQDVQNLARIDESELDDYLQDFYNVKYDFGGSISDELSDDMHTVTEVIPRGDARARFYIGYDDNENQFHFIDIINEVTRNGTSAYGGHETKLADGECI